MALPIAAGVAAIIKSQFPSYTALQVGVKLRVSCDNIDGINPTYAGQLGKGRVNMLKALTVNSPAVRLNSFTVTDGNNNVPQVNDTLTIIGSFKNYLDPTSGLSATITTTSTAVTSECNFITWCNPYTRHSYKCKCTIQSKSEQHCSFEFNCII